MVVFMDMNGGLRRLTASNDINSEEKINNATVLNSVFLLSIP